MHRSNLDLKTIKRSASERPFCFQPDGGEAGPEPVAALSPFLLTGEAGSSTANIPAAIAAIVSIASISCSGARRGDGRIAFRDQPVEITGIEFAA